MGKAPSRTIWLVRHGARADYVNGEWTRWEENPHDPPLSPLGQSQAIELAKFLERQEIHHIFVSPYLRTLQTVWPTARAKNLAIKVENGLGECLWNISEFPPLLSPEARERLFPLIDPVYTSWLPAWPSPETEEDSHQRGAAVAQALASRHAGNLLLLGHGVTVLGGVRGLVGDHQPLRTAFTAVSCVERNGLGWALSRNGDTSHLSPAAMQNQHVITWPEIAPG
jgi:broad specificity phosphatase PhoE